MPSRSTESREAQFWLRQHCHATHVRHVLERGLEYYGAVEQAGLCTQLTDGDDLFAFLSDAESAISRSRNLIQPTL